jgi:predicted AAA+ superfamily ATPase
MDNPLINRRLASHVKKVAGYYPVLSVAGPRQAGKSTMLKQIFPDYQYVSLEDPDTNAFATTDARGFFERYQEGIIIDEAQKVPELFSYLQGVVDQDRAPGRFILSGSQNYLMHRNITQSLAGRIDLSTLFPFDFGEMSWLGDWDQSAEHAILNGFYPGKLTNNIPNKIFYSNYIKTYIERDVTDLINVGNLTTFRSFLKLIAYKCGSQIRLTDLSNDLNISVNTIKTWISILESSYIVFMLPSYHKNMGKRLLKTPKLYFYDTGLLCHLLALNDETKLHDYDNYGIIFENLVIAELFKFKSHSQSEQEMYYFRDSNGLEVDLLEVDGFKTTMMEMKSSKTFRPKFLESMKKLKLFDPTLEIKVVYDGKEEVTLKDYSVVNWRNIHV